MLSLLGVFFLESALPSVGSRMLFWDCSALFWSFSGRERRRSCDLVSLMVFKACWQWSWTQDLAQSEAHAGAEQLGGLSAVSGEPRLSMHLKRPPLLGWALSPLSAWVCSPTYVPAMTWKRPRAKVNCCVPVDRVQWMPSTAHSWSMVPVSEAGSSCGGKSSSQRLPRVLAAEA